MKKVLVSSAAVALMPFLAFAQGSDIPTEGLNETAVGLQTLVNTLIPVLIAIAFIAFIVGIIRYLWAGGGEAKEKAKHQLIWGIVSITAILAVFGIARLFIDVFDLRPAQLQPDEVPYFPVGTAGDND